MPKGASPSESPRERAPSRMGDALKTLRGKVGRGIRKAPKVGLDLARKATKKAKKMSS